MPHESPQTEELVLGLTPEEEVEFEQTTTQLRELNASGEAASDELINRNNALYAKKTWGDPLPTAEDLAEQAANTQRLIAEDSKPL